jgi:D-alanine-D-alanine ligase
MTPVASTSKLMNGRRTSRKSHLRVLLLVHDEFFNRSAPNFLRETADTESEQAVLAGLKALHHDVFVLPFKPYRRELRAIADEIVRLKPDIIFNFIEHIEEDRRLGAHIPALLDELCIPYTGSPAIGIMASIDKATSKQAVRSVGFPVPPFVVLPVGATRMPRRTLDFPVIVKPRFGGASVGLTLRSVVHSKHELIRRARDIHQRLGEPAICEQYIDGPELSVGLIQDKTGILVLPIRETVFGRADEGGPRFCTERVKDSFRYRDRWDIRYERAQLPSALDRRIRTLCKDAFRVLGLSGYARIDLRLNAAGDPVFLEANANPDLSPRYFGIMALWKGLTYEDVLVKILRAGLNGRIHERRLL